MTAASAPTTAVPTLIHSCGLGGVTNATAGDSEAARAAARLAAPANVADADLEFEEPSTRTVLAGGGSLAATGSVQILLQVP